MNDTLTAELDTYHGNVSATELSYSKGVTSAIQTQFTGKISVDGWTATTGTYASANTITIASGGASKYTKGDKLRLKQGAGYKYYSIIAVADTLLTVTGGSDYTVADATITDMYYSHGASPVGFPVSFNYTPTVSATSGTITTATASSKFSVIGGSIAIAGTTTLTDKGTGTNTLRITLPVNNAISTVGAGRENASTGVTVQALVEVNYLYYFKYDGATMLVNGYSIIYSAVYPF